VVDLPERHDCADDIYLSFGCGVGGCFLVVDKI
jgi:hypothetical protein